MIRIDGRFDPADAVSIHPRLHHGNGSRRRSYTVRLPPAPEHLDGRFPLESLHRRARIRSVGILGSEHHFAVCGELSNYFFVPPVLSFRIGDPQNFVALATFEAVALLVSRLSTLLKAKEQAETQHRLELEKLYEFSRRILDPRSSIAGRFPDRGADPRDLRFEFDRLIRCESRASLCYGRLRPGDRNAGARGVPAGQDATVPRHEHVASRGAARVTPLGGIALQGPRLTDLTVSSIASLVAVAMERARSFERETRAEAGRAEQLRTAVLDALAHAFKSPLTAIRVASSGLLEAGRLVLRTSIWPRSLRSARTT